MHRRVFVTTFVPALLLGAFALPHLACSSEPGDDAEPLEAVVPNPPRASEAGASDPARASTGRGESVVPSDAGVTSNGGNASGGSSGGSGTDAAAGPASPSPAPTTTATAPTPAPTTTSPSSPPACGSPGPAVYASVDATSAWRYATEPGAPPGFAAQGLAFRLASDTSSRARANLYLLKSEKHGDFVVSTVPSEGAAEGYGAVAVLGTVYLQQLPGTVPLTRYYQTSPRLRHRVSIDGPVGGWDPEPPRGYVCPR